jgi:hypothetical protein
MIVNIWEEPPTGAAALLPMARDHGWKNLPVCRHDIKIAWQQAETDSPGGVLLRRHLPSRQYSAVAPSFDALVDALAWEAHEWQAVEAWRAHRKS